MFDSIVNVNDFFSSHWLAESFPTKLKDLNKVWKERAEHGKHSPLRQLAVSAGGFLARRAELPGPDDESFIKELTALHAVLLAAMGYKAEPTVLETEQAGTPIEIPLLARIQGPGAESLHVLQARPVESLDALFADDAGLIEPILVRHSETKTDMIRGIADAVQLLFLTEQAPRYLLIMAGSWVVVSDVERWAEGRYLAFDMDTAMSRRDDKPTGELAWHAGLWSSDVLLPADDGSTAIEEFSRDSVKHAVGVSADLREGLRTSVELIANAVIVARRQRGEMVEGDTDLPGELTRQSLRFLYRILFLLFAESRPELGVLPVGAAEYGAGYGLDRFRDLVQQPLTTEQALHGTHLHDSLRLLFRLVNEGYNQGIGGGDGLVFEPLRADLLEPAKARLVDDIDLPNEVLQQVLGLLLLSKPAKGRARGYVSYAQLGINQLGAVYEGLMSYSGFIADRRLVELAKDGDADKGTWLVPAENVGDYDEKHVVLREDRRTGAKTKVTHEKGTFVYRMSGRDRQRSASYYTPEVLTRTVVKHALAELIREDTTAAEILEYRICEPALGSGAFLNEAINQLAKAYLERMQRELDKQIPPEDFQGELQKVKAYLALHRAYGVDLNQTAVELAEVSLWLNVMHPGLQAPWFGLHLRQGNSLIGARRATYDLAALAKSKQNYWTTVPTVRPLFNPNGSSDIGIGEIHHFLLPAAGWGAVGDSRQAKELATERAYSLREWRKSVLKRPDRQQTDRLRGLATRVERMWDLTWRRLEVSEREVARSVDVWGRQSAVFVSSVTREQVEAALDDPESPYKRLRLVMDLWCALFYWPVSGPEISPPSLDEWIRTLEDLLGVQGKVTRGTTVDDLSSVDNEFDALGGLDDNERTLYGMRPVVKTLAERPWVGFARQVGEDEGSFHWELDFAHIFRRGGFELQVGNPPWVRPTWAEDIMLSEYDPYFMLYEKIPERIFGKRRLALLQVPESRGAYLSELSSAFGLNAHLGSAIEHPVLAGSQTNMYINFMERVWRSMRHDGIAGMLHPETHFNDSKAGDVRAEAYSRLRRHWQFINESQLFADIGHPVIYGIHVYGPPKEIDFLQACNLLLPQTLEESLNHDGTGERPSIQYPWGGWDYRPHSSRVMRVTESVLADWARIFDDVGTSPKRARLMRPLLAEHLDGLKVISKAGSRLSDVGYDWTSFWHEKGAKEDGTIRWETLYPENLDDVVLQGPHISVSNPYAKEPNENCRSKGDYSAWDLVNLADRVVPRTNYQRSCTRDSYDSRMPHWNGKRSTEYWRLVWRRMTQPGLERSLSAALIMPGPGHVDGLHTMALGSNRMTALSVGLWSSIVYDYLVKIGGIANVYPATIQHFPAPLKSPVAPLLLLRTLRLNCLTRDYSPLWAELYDASFLRDSWTSSFRQWPKLGHVGATWSMETPLRSDFERRAALVEIDALTAIMLGLSADHLVLIFTGQFGVLRKYEHTMWFDNRGDRIGKEPHAKGLHQMDNDYSLLMAYNAGETCGDLLERYESPFVKVDRETEMRVAHAEFTGRLGL